MRRADAPTAEVRMLATPHPAFFGRRVLGLRPLRFLYHVRVSDQVDAGGLEELMRQMLVSYRPVD